ncbi:MAG: hypothetical protein WAU42_09330, partial [Solirubrobacteraceae bacterium]
GKLFLIDPCLVGSWTLHQAYSANELGLLTLGIAPSGVMTLTYAFTLQPVPPTPPLIVDNPPALTLTSIQTEIDPPSTFHGTAMGQVLAPLSTDGQPTHQLLWGITTSTVEGHLVGYRTVEEGEQGTSLLEGDEIVWEETPFRYIREVPVWDYLAPQLTNSTSYECDETHGIGTLKLVLPYDNPNEVEFWRAGRKSNG